MLTQCPQEVPVALARFEDAAAGLEMCDQFSSQCQRGLDIIIANVIAVRLGTHGAGEIYYRLFAIYYWPRANPLTAGGEFYFNHEWALIRVLKPEMLKQIRDLGH